MFGIVKTWIGQWVGLTTTPIPLLSQVVRAEQISAATGTRLPEKDGLE
jgi:hypothetical protein